MIFSLWNESHCKSCYFRRRVFIFFSHIMLPAVKRLGPHEGILELWTGTPGNVKFHPGEMLSLYQRNQCLIIKPGFSQGCQGMTLSTAAPLCPMLLFSLELSGLG